MLPQVQVRPNAHKNPKSSSIEIFNTEIATKIQLPNFHKTQPSRKVSSIVKLYISPSKFHPYFTLVPNVSIATMLTYKTKQNSMLVLLLAHATKIDKKTYMKGT